MEWRPRRVAHVLAPHARLPPHNISATDRASAPAAVVLLFFKASGCPFSASLLPVVQCSAVFFSPDVPFIALQQVRASGSSKANTIAYTLLCTVPATLFAFKLCLQRDLTSIWLLCGRRLSGQSAQGGASCCSSWG